MKIKVRNKIIGVLIGVLLGTHGTIFLHAIEEMPEDLKESQNTERSEVQNLIKQIQIETAKDGTLNDENHQTLKRVALDMLEKQGEPIQETLILPISSNVRISAGTWHYGNSFNEGYHLGIDFASPISTEVKAVSDGIILATSNACPTVGYLGSSCGSPGTEGGGNQVYLLCKIKDSCYIIKYLHLRQDSMVTVGALVKQNDKIGEVGSSGNSSGPHVHVEVIRLEEENLSEFLENWDGDLSFHLGFKRSGYESRCEINSKAPCREKPESIFELHE